MVKILSVVGAQCLQIGDEPGFHALHHHVTLLFGCTLRAIPPIMQYEVLPWGPINGGLSVHKQNIEGSGVCSERYLEHAVGIFPWAARDNTPSNILLTRTRNQITEKLAETLAKEGLCIITIAATFDVDVDFRYHRVPPISPIRQSSPSE